MGGARGHASPFSLLVLQAMPVFLPFLLLVLAGLGFACPWHHCGLESLPLRQRAVIERVGVSPGFRGSPGQHWLLGESKHHTVGL